MEEVEFWNLIARSRQKASTCDRQAAQLGRLLAALPPESIVAFDRHFTHFRILAYRWDLWAVAYILNGGCSDDGFDYFRCWLIGQGKAAYRAALASPETVGDLVDEDEPNCECEAFLYAAAEAHEQVTGSELPPSDNAHPAEPAGEQWEEEDLERLYPNVFARF